MMRNVNDYGVTTAEWLASIHNIDLLDPDADYICGLRPIELTRESKDFLIHGVENICNNEAVYDYEG